MSALWQVWTEGASRDDAAVIRAQLPRAAANAFAEVHVLGRDKDTCGGFEVFVSQEGSQDVRTFEYYLRSRASRSARNSPRDLLGRLDEEARSARRWIACLEDDLARARDELARRLALRERMFSGLTQSERDEALLARTSRDDALSAPVVYSVYKTGVQTSHFEPLPVPPANDNDSDD